MLNDLNRELEAAQKNEDNKKLKPDFRPHVEMGDTGGTAATGLIDGSLISSDDDLLRFAGLDPNVWCLEAGTKRIWMHTNDDKRSIYFGFRKKTQDNAVAEWLASRFAFAPVSAVDDEQADGVPLIVCLADMQTGKANELHGGTKELIQRAHSVLRQIQALCEYERPRHIVIADLGDICEGTMNHTSSSQAASNDLPQSEQLRVAGRIIMEYVATLAPYCEHLTLCGVRSNHGEERLQDGKTNGWGDYGIMLIKTVGDAIQLLGTGLQHVEVAYEKPFDHGLPLMVGGARIVFLHGHYAKKLNRLGDWVATQAGGVRSNIYQDAQTVIHGHFHHLSVQESRGRMIYGCPALEGGSDWLTRSNGEYSSPGVLTLRVRDGRVCGLRVFEPLEGVNDHVA